jgi:integrase/recombinase XerC
MQPNTIRLRLATLGSFGKWAVRRDRLPENPLDKLTRPKKWAKLPSVPRWEAVEDLLKMCPRLRDRALLALMTYGGLRRAGVVALNVGDFVPESGLRRVQGKAVTRRWSLFLASPEQSCLSISRRSVQAPS